LRQQAKGMTAFPIRRLLTNPAFSKRPDRACLFFPVNRLFFCRTIGMISDFYVRLPLFYVHCASTIWQWRRTGSVEHANAPYLPRV
jgi:hypothetical protein